MTKTNKLHFFCFLVVLAGLILLTAYQLFVTPQFTRLPLSQFLKVSTLKQLFVKAPDLGQPQNFPDPNPLIVDCQTQCQFLLNDQTVKTLVDNDPEAKINALELKFFDQKKGLIGYQIPDSSNPTFFVLDSSGNLLQTIRLNLNQFRLLEFVNYYPVTREILFKSIHQQDQTQEHWLYSANSPSLRSISL